MTRPRLSNTGHVEGLAALEQLGSSRVIQHAELLPSSMNPAMDVALLFSTPPSGSTAAVAASGSNPNGGSAAPVSLAHARMREMMLRRQQQAAAARGGGGAAAGKNSADKVPEPTRGQPIKASLWRMGEESTLVWEVNLPRPAVFPVEKTPSTEPENEDCAVVEMAWSTDGRKAAIQMVLTRSRSQTAGPSASGAPTSVRKAIVIVLLSVEDGSVFKIIKVSDWSGPSDQVGAHQYPKMTWTANAHLPQLIYDEEDELSPSASFYDNEIATLRCLSPLPSLLELTSYGVGLDPTGKSSGPKLMPHQMRLQQLRGGGISAPEDEVLPSVASKGWQGSDLATRSLAQLPVLPIDAIRWGVVDSNEELPPKVTKLGQDARRDRNRLLSSLLTCSDEKGRVHVFAQGTSRIGTLELASHQPLFSAISPHLDRAHAMISSEKGMEMSLHELNLGLANVSRNQLLSTSTTLHHLFSYLLDTLHLMIQVFKNVYRGQAVDEWQKHVEDIESKALCSFKTECITAITGGRMSDFLEVLVMTDINESALIKMEEATYTSLRFMRRAAATSIGPCCERILSLLHGLQNLDKKAQSAVGLVQELLRASLRIEKETEKELLAAGEFYKWWKQERDKHENPRREEGAFHPLIHDTLAATEYVQRGFNNPTLQKLLGSKDCTLVPLQEEPSLQEEPLVTRAAASARLDQILAETASRLDASIEAIKNGDQLPAVPILPASGNVVSKEGATELFLGSTCSPRRTPRKSFRGTLWAHAAQALECIAGTLEARLSESLNAAREVDHAYADCAVAVNNSKQIASYSPKATALPVPRTEDTTHSLRLLLSDQDPSQGHISVFMRSAPAQEAQEERHVELLLLFSGFDTQGARAKSDKLSAQVMTLPLAFLKAKNIDVIDAGYAGPTVSGLGGSHVILLVRFQTPDAPQPTDAVLMHEIPEDRWEGCKNLQDALSLLRSPSNAEEQSSAFTAFWIPRDLRPAVSVSISTGRRALGILGGPPNERAFATFDVAVAGDLPEEADEDA